MFVTKSTLLLFSGINISNNDAGGLHSAFPTWFDLIKLKDIQKASLLPMHLSLLSSTLNEDVVQNLIVKPSLFPPLEIKLT